MNEIEKIAETIEKLFAVVGCPNCDGSGAFHDSYGEPAQCQFCDERNRALRDLRGIKVVLPRKITDALNEGRTLIAAKLQEPNATVPEYEAYIDRAGWSFISRSPEQAIAALAEKIKEAK